MKQWIKMAVFGAALAGGATAFAAAPGATTLVAQGNTVTWEGPGRSAMTVKGDTVTVADQPADDADKSDKADKTDKVKADKEKADLDAAEKAVEEAADANGKAAWGAQHAEQMARAQAQLERAQAEVAAKAATMRDIDQQLKTARAWTVAMPGGKKEKVAFLGIVTTPATPELRENLGLQRGLGLVVQTVEDDSAAGKAGLQKYDILQKLDDQMLVNSQQLGVLVRLHKNGDKVTLTILRKGKEQKVEATLTEKETFVSDAGDAIEQRIFNVDALPGAAVGGFMRPAAIAPVAPVPPVPPAAWVPKVAPFRARGQNPTANIIHTDDEMTLELTAKDNSRHLKAKDKDGKILYDGPIDNDDQRKAVPEAVAKRLDKIEKNLFIVPDVQTGDVAVRVQGGNAE
jgi:serine protease Do